MISEEKKLFHINETKKHKQKVKDYLGLISKILEKRGNTHDDSKLENMENEIFSVYSSKLKDCTYGSEDYKRYLNEMRPALDHHYKNNRHHPEHFEDGIRGMNLIDLMEMVMDWLAASKRHDSGNIMKSIELNMSRFGYDETLNDIFKNTIEYLNEYRMEEVEKLYTPEDNDNVKSIVHDWMVGKYIYSKKYKKMYTEKERERASEIILDLISSGLG